MVGESRQGRRVLHAIVNGEVGARIQHWRREHDPDQALRYPPHVTLVYDVPREASLDALEAQVRHAFAEPAGAHLGGPRVFEEDGRALYIEVLDSAALDRARERLYDGTHLALGRLEAWTWHVTALRRTAGAPAEVLRLAEEALCLDAPWRVDEVALLELRRSRYRRIATWWV